MTYQPRPKISDDTLLKSRDQIRTDFEIIQDRFNDNHVDFNDGTGKHTTIQMLEQATPNEATGANEGNLVAREYNGRTELAWRPESTAAAGDQYFLSAMPIRAAGTFNTTTGDGAKTLNGLSFNVTSVTRTSNSFAVIMTNAAPSQNYFIIATRSGTAAANFGINAIDNSTTQFTLTMVSGGSLDNVKIGFVVFGG